MKWLDRALISAFILTALLTAYGSDRHRQALDGLITANLSLLEAVLDASENPNIGACR